MSSKISPGATLPGDRLKKNKASIEVAIVPASFTKKQDFMEHFKERKARIWTGRHWDKQSARIQNPVKTSESLRILQHIEKSLDVWQIRKVWTNESPYLFHTASDFPKLFHMFRLLQTSGSMAHASKTKKQFRRFWNRTHSETIWTFRKRVQQFWREWFQAISVRLLKLSQTVCRFSGPCEAVNDCQSS